MKYREEEVTVIGEYPLTASLCIPEGDGPFTAVVIVAGSGNGDRDGNIKKMKFMPNMYRDLANFISELGFITIRSDKRGTGNSGGKLLEAGMFDLVEDIQSQVCFLKNHPKVNRVILLGHSEGCTLIAAANARQPVDGLIFLAGGAESLSDALVKQRTLARQELLAMKGIKGAIIRLTKTHEKVEKQATKLYEKMLETDKPVIRYQLQKINAKWFREHLQYNVFDDLKKVACPALAINGSTDIQVTPEKALDLAKYVKGPAQSFVVEGMNHILKENNEKAAILDIMKSYKADMNKPLHPELKKHLQLWLEAYANKTDDNLSCTA